MATPLNAESKKRQKLGVFANRGQQKKPIEMKFGTYKRTLRVYYITSNLAVIGKRGSVEEAVLQKLKFTQNCGFRPPEAGTMNIFR